MTKKFGSRCTIVRPYFLWEREMTSAGWRPTETGSRPAAEMSFAPTTSTLVCRLRPHVEGMSHGRPVGAGAQPRARTHRAPACAALAETTDADQTTAHRLPGRRGRVPCG